MKTHFSVYFGLIITLLLFSCTGEKEKGDLSIKLTQEVDGVALVLNEWIYEAPVGHPYKMRRLQMLLSDFVLHNKNGELIEFDMYHYFEFGRPETQSFSLGDIEPGTYNKISFVFGLNEEKNLDNAYPDDYDMVNFKWPTALGKGYHYMRFEVTADSMASGVIKDFNLHTGASNGNQNFIVFNLEMDDMEVDGNEFELDLVMNMNDWLREPHLYDFEEFGHGIMGNQEAQIMLKENGADVFRIEGPVHKSN